MLPAALLLLSALPSGAPDSLEFKRAFKLDAKSSYTLKMGPHGEKEMLTCQYTETVDFVGANGANVKFEVVKTDVPGLGTSEVTPPLTSSVGWDNMPNAGSIKNGTEFFVFGSLAGIAPNTSAKVGDTVNTSWENQSKDVKFVGSGHLKSSDSTAKTLTVEWSIVMTPSYTTGGTFKLTSTYALGDFSLVKSAGTFTVGKSVMDISVTLDPSKPA